jgi:transcription elongation factor Elf1
MSAYWNLINRHFEKATGLLGTGDDDDLTYACLELRKCLEAYAYDLLMGYLSEAPMRVIETWQPDKVLKELLAIDPQSAMTYTINWQRAATETEPAGKWQTMGEDRRLPVEYVRKNYQALGSFLHVPTIRQSSRDNDPAPARQRATEVQEAFAKLLAPGRITAFFAKGMHRFECHDCGTPIARRADSLLEGKTAECGNCGLPYDVEILEDQKVWIQPRSILWDCPRCQSHRTIFASKAKDGTDVSCPECQLQTTIRVLQQLHIQYDSDAGGDPVPPAPC